MLIVTHMAELVFELVVNLSSKSCSSGALTGEAYDDDATFRCWGIGNAMKR